jgi:hypothetical protein
MMHVTNACAGQVFLTVYNDGAVGEGSSVVSPSAVVHTALERCSECPRYRVAAEVLPISWYSPVRVRYHSLLP